MDLHSLRTSSAATGGHREGVGGGEPGGELHLDMTREGIGGGGGEGGTRPVGGARRRADVSHDRKQGMACAGCFRSWRPAEG
jgi:hypothetical protein